MGDKERGASYGEELQGKSERAAPSAAADEPAQQADDEPKVAAPVQTPEEDREAKAAKARERFLARKRKAP